MYFNTPQTLTASGRRLAACARFFGAAYLSDEEVERLLRLVRSVLAPGGRLLTLDGFHEDNQPLIARFLLRRDRGSSSAP